MKRNTKKIAFALLLNLFLFFVLMFVLDVTGTFSLDGLLSSFGFSESDPAKIEDPYFLAREEIEKQYQAINLRENDLGQMMETIRSNELLQRDKEDQLISMEKQLKEREVKAAETELEKVRRSERVKEVANQLVNMPPQQAVDRLVQQTDDLLVIDILRAIDALAAAEGKASTVPYFLSLLPPERVAAWQRKMANINMLTNDSDF